MAVIREHEILLLDGSAIKQGLALSFYGQQAYRVLHQAQQYGEVFTLPEFLQTSYLSSFQSSLLGVPFTVQTEEIFGKSRQGNHVAIVVHGKGLLTPKRIREGIRYEKVMDDEIPNHGLTRTISGRGQFALPLYDYEVHNLLDGFIVPTFSYSEFKKLSRLPTEYGVVRDFHPHMEALSGEQFLSKLLDIPRVVSLAGGLENLGQSIEALKQSGLKKINYSHYLNYLKETDLETPQGRFMQVHWFGNIFNSQMEMDGPARFLAVKRSDLEEKIDREFVIEVEA